MEKNTKIAAILLKLAELEETLENVLETRYFNHQQVIEMTIHKPLAEISFTLADILLIAGITQSNILLSGSSGRDRKSVV